MGASTSWPSCSTDAKPVAVGHHVVGPAPMILDGRVFGLDTDACHGGRLTALSVPDFTIHSVAARSGRINLDRQCSTPRRTIALAAALGVATPELPVQAPRAFSGRVSTAAPGWAAWGRVSTKVAPCGLVAR
ncbi:hypothetical protein [Actinoplanes subtropicus]|uniref:hypothetical protein n=1 Tax=Actinoplanes subtropicus TaxID=543632 RepID=UPI0012FB98A1|nr:hypothetical protein [Actinoplanes subtropicus]